MYVYYGARLGYHPHIFSTTAESIAKTNENVARQNANEEKNVLFFFKCVVSPIGEKQHTMAAGSSPLRSTLNTFSHVWTCVKYVPKQSIA